MQREKERESRSTTRATCVGGEEKCGRERASLGRRRLDYERTGLSES